MSKHPEWLGICTNWIIGAPKHLPFDAYFPETISLLQPFLVWTSCVWILGPSVAIRYWENALNITPEAWLAFVSAFEIEQICPSSPLIFFIFIELNVPYFSSILPHFISLYFKVAKQTKNYGGSLKCVFLLWFHYFAVQNMWIYPEW